MSQIDALEEQFEEAESLKDVSSSKAITILKAIVSAESEVEANGDRLSLMEEERWCLVKERAIYALSALLSASGLVLEVEALLVAIRSSRFFGRISKAKSGKMMRSLVSAVSPSSKGHRSGSSSASSTVDYSVAIRVCSECVAWCVSEGRQFLRQQMECSLVGLLLSASLWQRVLSVLTRLLSEVKAVDDKHLLVELHLMESKLHHNLKNVAKAKAALTASRAAAHSIYIGPLVQAEMDEQAGSISAEEGDYKTAYSYFYEAFEGFDALKDRRAERALQYMLLTKILNDEPNDVRAVMAGKLAIKYQGDGIQIMAEIAASYRDRDLAAFDRIAASDKADSIRSDIVIQNKVDELKNKLLEQNLLRLLEPFERVEIEHIAKLIQLDTATVHRQLEHMILDKTLHGILDQGSGAVIVFDKDRHSNLYQNALDTVDQLGHAVDRLFEKANALD